MRARSFDHDGPAKRQRRDHAESPIGNGLSASSDSTKSINQASKHSNPDDSTNQASEQPSNRSNRNEFLPMICYPFILSLVTRYLSDDDVLCGLVPTMKPISQSINQSVNQSFSCYIVKMAVSPSVFVDLSNSVKSMNLLCTSLKDVEDLSVSSDSTSQSINQSISHSNPETAIKVWESHFWSSVTSLVLTGEFDQSLERHSLPARLKILKFHNSDFNQSINPGILPATLQYLELGESFKQPLQIGSLPASLRSLKFLRPVSSPFQIGVLPDSLTYLNLTYKWQLVKNVLPRSLKQLILHDRSKKKEKHDQDALPSALQTLSFHSSDTRHINLDLPKSLKKLSFHSEHLQVSPGSLPSGLKHLTIHGGYDSVLPDSLEYLDIDGNVRLDILPSSLSEVVMTWFNSPVQAGSFSRLTSLTFGQFNQPLSVGVLPDSLLFLDLGQQFKQRLIAGMIPFGVVQLVMTAPCKYVIKAGDIPTSVTHLTIDQASKRLRKNSLPNSITHLKTSMIESNLIPTSVTHLTVMNYAIHFQGYPISIKRLKECGIPVSVTHLRFMDDVTHHLIPGIIPPLVTHLAFGSCYNEIPPDVLPNHLQYLALSLSSYYSYPIMLPSSVQEVCISSKYSDVMNGLNRNPVFIGASPRISRGKGWQW